MSDERRADRREERHRKAMKKTARTLYETARKTGAHTTYTDHLRRVQSADSKRPKD